MEVRKIIETYYELANSGNWSKWCDLFSEDLVMDEQLAGRIETLATLRQIMDGMGSTYKKFQNIPKHIIVEGNQVAVVSHVSARSAKHPDIPIEAEVMNYFRIENGKITYMANYHDSRPFKHFLENIF